MARPTKYTEEVVNRLVQALNAGASYKLACGFAGITFETFTQWRKSKPGFTDRLARAEAAAGLRWLTKIEQLADSENDWRALAWKLERRYPEDYGKSTVDHRLTGPHGGPIQEEHTVTIREIVVHPPGAPDDAERDGGGGDVGQTMLTDNAGTFEGEATLMEGIG